MCGGAAEASGTPAYGAPVARCVWAAPLVTVWPMAETSCPAPAIVPQADNSEPAPSNINKLRNNLAVPQRVLIIRTSKQVFHKCNRWMRGKFRRYSDRRPLSPHQIAQYERASCYPPVTQERSPRGGLFPPLRSLSAVASFIRRTAWGRRKQTEGTAMDDNQIGGRASKAADEMKNGAAAATETAGDLAGKTQAAVAGAASTIRDAASETVRQVRDTATQAYGQGAQAAEYVSRNTTEQPLTALLIAGAIGYGIAYMVHAR